MFHVLTRDRDGRSCISPAEVSTVFRVAVPGDPSVAYRLDGITLVDPAEYRVDDLRIGGRSQFAATTGGIPGEVFVTYPGEAQLDLVPGGSTIDLALTYLGGGDLCDPDCTIRLTAIGPRATSSRDESVVAARETRWRDTPPTAVEVDAHTWWWRRDRHDGVEVVRLTTDGERVYGEYVGSDDGPDSDSINSERYEWSPCPRPS